MIHLATSSFSLWFNSNGSGISFCEVDMEITNKSVDLNTTLTNHDCTLIEFSQTLMFESQNKAENQHLRKALKTAG